MPSDVIMPALGMAQETGKVLRWLKAEGETVAKGEPLLEIETDKVTVEIEAPAAGTLAGVRAAEGEDVPVGQVIALVLGAGVEKDVEKGDVSYYPDALLLGDCTGHFRRDDSVAGGEKLGRAAVATDLDDDGCPDLLVGNYRGFPNDPWISDCRGHYHRDAHHPAVGIERAYFGHTMALFPWDLERRGRLDLAVVNLWHPDERGADIDPAAPLAGDWWTLLGDPVLDDLEARALSGNPGIAAARARIE